MIANRLVLTVLFKNGIEKTYSGSVIEDDKLDIVHKELPNIKKFVGDVYKEGSTANLEIGDTIINISETVSINFRIGYSY